MVLLARKDEEGNTQTLYDHLHGAGRLASGFEDEFADISRTAAVLHDVGKVAQQFQTYLLSDDGHRGDVQHARQGAFVVNDFFESKGEIEEIAKEILELAISKHHGGLPDCIDESGNRAFLLGFTESDKSNEKYAYQEIKRGLNGLALDLQSNFRGSAEDIACFLKKIKSLGMSKDSIYFYLGLLVKLIYSRLVDADRTDAACFETRKQYRPNTVDWQNLISRLDKSMRSFDSSSEINRIRHQINEQCCLAGARETGIYRLSIPTGGGKTLASLNFALHHALKTGKHRIIYVIPYLSITTQTAKTFRDVLGLNADSDVLLEHYSTAGMQRSADVADNASSEFEDAGEHQRKLAAERWDNPIIVTTMVEFLETVMSARGTKLRKFHNMADSVIIFDEIQSLPMNTINLFNEIVSFLSKITNSTILLCSATQPLLEKTKRENLLLSEKPDLIAETESYEDKLRRTRIVASTENKSCDELGQIIYQQARKDGNCLAIVNLKKEAREIFQCLERLDVNHEFELIHLSTAMCGRHRTDCLNRIGALLDPGNPKPVICVSTQLIEAGVDISFACVVRAMAGLDSIMQAAGRCNRNGESVEPKNVYVYPLKDEDSMERYLPDIAMGKQLTLQIMENYPGKDLLSSNILEQYYDMLLRKKDGNGKGGYTDCPIRGRAEGATTAYDLLSFNECDRSQFTNTTGEKYGLCFAQAFQTVSDNFHVIPDVTHNVVVPYGQATELLDMLHRGELSEKISVLRRLQEYTVSLFDDDYHDLARKHAISLANEDFGVFLLNEEYYNDKYFIVGKLYNAKWVLERTKRDHALRVNIDRLAEQSGKLSAALSKARKSLTIDELRGVEGLAAKDYFYAFDDLVLKNKDDFFFTSRSRRPPLDRLNALLSFCYSILTNDCIAALQGVGLDPYVGFMHTDRPGRASLALDLVEEFRPVLADRFVLTLVNTGAVKPGDFEIRENGGVLLSDFGRKKVLTAWQKKKSDQILHPFLQEKISWGLVPYVQALLLARSLRGDLDDYPPFMWK